MWSEMFQTHLANKQIIQQFECITKFDLKFKTVHVFKEKVKQNLQNEST